MKQHPPTINADWHRYTQDYRNWQRGQDLKRLLLFLALCFALFIAALLLTGCNNAEPTATATPVSQPARASATSTPNAVTYVMDCAVLVTVNKYKSSDIADTVIRVYQDETYLGVTTMSRLMECVR